MQQMDRLKLSEVIRIAKKTFKSVSRGLESRTSNFWANQINRNIALDFIFSQTRDHSAVPLPSEIQLELRPLNHRNEDRQLC